MVIPLDFLLDKWDLFLLVLIRMTGLFVIAPIFGRRNIPAYFKIGFAFFVSVVIINVIPTPNLEEYKTVYAFFSLIIKEFVLGVTLGFISYMVLIAIYMAGQMIDMRIGFGMVNVIDPLSNIQIPVTANFYFILTMLFFLIIDGHHLLIYAITDSFKIVPIGNSLFTDNLLSHILRLFQNAFFIGFKIAAPITAAILITDVALGVISKTVPQINVFMIGLPLKILVGLLIMFITIVSFRGIVHVLMEGMYREMYKWMESLSKQ